MTVTLAAVSRAAAKAVSASQNRDDLIRQAHADGFTIRAIAAVCGLSPARVHQIIHRR
jgi:DNA-directed RNA polymerase specialized sigma24 family protein